MRLFSFASTSGVKHTFNVRIVKLGKAIGKVEILSTNLKKTIY